ncbi:hypothetical protein LCGC14_1403290 [marine sediment metagenome]|uniref:Uncharacterized protein n=1 Tax=marine sediment metagenome TaxID=412755 RepID=A0A0F9JWF2_9ZZZZ
MKETVRQRNRRLKRIKRPRWNSHRKRRERAWPVKDARHLSDIILSEGLITEGLEPVVR